MGRYQDVFMARARIRRNTLCIQYAIAYALLPESHNYRKFRYRNMTQSFENDIIRDSLYEHGDILNNCPFWPIRHCFGNCSSVHLSSPCTYQIVATLEVCIHTEAKSGLRGGEEQVFSLIISIRFIHIQPHCPAFHRCLSDMSLWIIQHWQHAPYGSRSKRQKHTVLHSAWENLQASQGVVPNLLRSWSASEACQTNG